MKPMGSERTQRNDRYELTNISFPPLQPQPNWRRRIYEVSCCQLVSAPSPSSMTQCEEEEEETAYGVITGETGDQ